MKAHLVHGSNGIKALSVAIYANSLEDAQTEYLFRYANLGYVLCDDAQEVPVKSTSEEQAPSVSASDIPVIQTRKRLPVVQIRSRFAAK